MDKQKIKKLILGLLLQALLCVSHITAATDGTLGATSEGRLDISLTINALVMISNLNDFNFGNYGGAGDVTGDDDICIYRNDPAGQYRVTATATEGLFVIKSAANESIPYSVFFNDERDTQGAIELSYNASSPTQSGANSSSTTCFFGKVLNSNISVKFEESDLQAAVTGSYRGTLILAVDPV